MSIDEVRGRIRRTFDDPRIIEAAMAKSVADARRQYAHAEMPMAPWKNGRVVRVDLVTLEEVPRPNALPFRTTSSSE